MMVAAGVLTQYDRIELIDGDLLNMASIGSRHSAITSRLHELFVLAVSRTATVVSGGPVDLGVAYREPSAQGYGRMLEYATVDRVAPLAFPDVKIAAGEIFV